MSIFRANKTYVNLVRTAALTVGVAAGVLSVTYSELELERAVAQSRPRQPNVVVIMADDLSRSELGVARAQGWMPNLETYLINRGTTFTQSFVSFPLCCPSRSTFLTGQYPHNHGVWSNFLPRGGVTRLQDKSTLATWLQRAGYRTCLIGKYLNGYGEDLVAADPSDDPTYIPPGWNDWQALQAGSGYYNYTINDNGKLVNYGVNPAKPATEYQTDVLARRSVRFINKSEALSDPRPFFLFITPSAPHIPVTPAPRHSGTASSLSLYQKPSFNELDVRDKPAWLQKLPRLSPEETADIRNKYRRKLESLRAIDDLIGKVVFTLAQNNELDNTVLIFTSDNGCLSGDHRLTGKNYVYEESIRVPLHMRVPGFPKQSTSRLVINNDLAPTIADFADATPNILVDGRSLIPLLREPSRINWRKRFLVEHYKPGSSTGGILEYTAIRTSTADTATPNQLYVKYARGDQEFYDFVTDPYQLRSLHRQSGRRQQQMQILRNRLVKLEKCRGQNCRILEDY